MSSSDPSKALLWTVAVHNEINITDIQYYSSSLPVGKGRLKERRGLEARTNVFRLRRWQKLGAD
jgi:hypothetical protein